MPQLDRRPKSSPRVVGNGPWRLSTFLSIQLDADGFPLVGEEFGQSAHGVSADALKQIAQISEGIDTQSLGSRDEAAEHGGGAPAGCPYNSICPQKKLDTAQYHMIPIVIAHGEAEP